MHIADEYFRKIFTANMKKIQFNMRSLIIFVTFATFFLKWFHLSTILLNEYNYYMILVMTYFFIFNAIILLKNYSIWHSNTILNKIESSVKKYEFHFIWKSKTSIWMISSIWLAKHHDAISSWSIFLYINIIFIVVS